MSKRTCKDCRNRFSDEGTCPVRFGVTDTDDATKCDTFEPITVFDRVTQSPETLAGKLVYEAAVEGQKTVYDRLGRGVGVRPYIYYVWKSTITGDDTHTSEEEAIAATVAKLKGEQHD